MIRVMTVHGAKGLEAPVVILPDTGDRRARASGPLVRLAGGEAVWGGPSAEAPERWQPPAPRWPSGTPRNGCGCFMWR
jgi:ATP-dependent exoDNAse (exonuclease V) beta subunit